MATKPADLKQILFRVKQLQIRRSTTDEDYQGVDLFINDLGVAHRKRAIESALYGEISIRKRDYTNSEYEKILTDTTLADLWIFEFTDAYIICQTKDIKECLKSGKARYIPNKDEPNGGYYIFFDHLPHLWISKQPCALGTGR